MGSEPLAASTAAVNAITPPIQVLFALLPDSLVLDWAGPAEALRIANQVLAAQGLPPRFALGFISPCASAVSSVGVNLAGLAPLPDKFDRPTWIVLLGLPGRTIDIDNNAARSMLHWLRGLRLASGELELVTVCAGSVLAAHAGLLAGRRVTTHHHHLQELQAAEPACKLLANRVFVEDPPIYSSAGVTTGIDLMLHRINTVCGPVVAAQVAQTMVLALRRGPQDPELSPFLDYRKHLNASVHRVQDAVSQQPAHDWSVPSMAAVAHTSARHLTRLFMEHAGVAPLHYLRKIRLAVAQAALESGRNVTQAAEMAGFSSDTQLRRAWHQFGLTGTPSRF
ncbi:MAG: helix-turn-helix domain-containing protein [Pseudomonadota bacterium]